MEISQVKLVYFSPTGTTRRVLESIAAGLEVKQIQHIDLTPPGVANQAIPPLADQLILIGAPVYGGRLPVEAVRRFRQLKADRCPAVIVVVYGNREFEDALLELKHLAIDLGFNPIAGGAFIGEHSFATESIPIANGRPDALDAQKAAAFGAKVKETLAAMVTADAPIDLAIPGRFPYESSARSMTVSPVSVEGVCAVCGDCVDVCPTAAISINGSTTTEAKLCIRCSACIKACPSGGRVWEDAMMKKITNWLHENCSARKEPQVFGVEM